MNGYRNGRCSVVLKSERNARMQYVTLTTIPTMKAIFDVINLVVLSLSMDVNAAASNR